MLLRSDHYVGAEDHNRPTIRALVRRGRIEKAIKATPSLIVCGWEERDPLVGRFQLDSPDEDFAKTLGLQIRTRPTTNANSDGSVTSRRQHALVIPLRAITARQLTIT